jgi:hypothetical protein
MTLSQPLPPLPLLSYLLILIFPCPLLNSLSPPTIPSGHFLPPPIPYSISHPIPCFLLLFSHTTPFTSPLRTPHSVPHPVSTLYPPSIFSYHPIPSHLTPSPPIPLSLLAGAKEEHSREAQCLLQRPSVHPAAKVSHRPGLD